MKKIIKSKKIKYLVFTMLGIIIGSSIGITANYLLRAEDVEYVDKDNNSTTVQSAITDLYSKASSGNNKNLVIDTINKTHNSLTISFAGNYITATCSYGENTNNSYENSGIIMNNTCEITNLNPETTYKYQIITSDNLGKIYVAESTETTNSSPSLEYFSNPTIVYFNPVTNTKCNKNNYTENNSLFGVSEGCMKWYAYKRYGNDYSLLLDHSIAKAYYNYSNTSEVIGNRSKEQIAVDSGNTIYFNDAGYELQQLTQRSTNPWHNNLNPDLITLTDIEQITHVSELQFFSSLCKNSGQCDTGENEYAWLFSYLENCEDYGCNKNDNNAGFYYTKTPFDEGNIYAVTRVGKTGPSSVQVVIGSVRPVITVSNSILNIS